MVRCVFEYIKAAWKGESTPLLHVKDVRGYDGMQVVIEININESFKQLQQVQLQQAQ